MGKAIFILYRFTEVLLHFHIVACPNVKNVSPTQPLIITPKQWRHVAWVSTIYCKSLPQINIHLLKAFIMK